MDKAERNRFRILNEALDIVNEQIDGVKSTVKSNVTLSIVIGSVVLALLLLCWYIQRKYSTPKRIISKKDYEREQQKLKEDNKDRDGTSVNFPVKLNDSSETKDTQQDEEIGESEGVEVELRRK